MIKKSIYLWVVVAFLSSCISDTCDDNKYLETAAVATLDEMSASIGELNSCSYTLQVNSERLADSLGIISYEAISDVYMRGPNKMYIHINSSQGDRGFWYDGSLLAWFNYNEHVFDTLPAPATIMETINSAHDNYGVDFPAADFFYPTFTDDIIQHFDSVFYMGMQTHEGEDISEVLAVNAKMKVNIWIANNGTRSYPVGFYIMNKVKGIDLHYEGDFSNWRFNPELPDHLFEFSPPENATRKVIQPLKK